MSDFVQADYTVEETVKGVRALLTDNSGIPPQNMKSFTLRPGDASVKITFEEPEDTVIDGQLICTTKGVIIVRKQGSMPENMDDGVIVLQNEEIGKYKNTPFVDSGLTNDVDYYYRFFAYSDHGVFNMNLANSKAVRPQEYILYGFKIDKNDSNPATRVTYLEMAEGMTPAYMDYSAGKFNYGSWNPEEIFFLQNNYPAMVKADGTEDYKLDPEDYTKKLDGSASDVSNTGYNGNAMARMDTVWLYQYEDSNYEYCYICNIQLTEDYHAYAHQRADGSIMEYRWYSLFDGSLVNNKVRSIKGQSTMNSQTGANEIAYAKANGDLWYTRSHSERELIKMLLILMGKSDNTQAVFGNGHYTGGSQASNLLKTGTLSDKGRFYGTNGTGVGVKVFHIENFWGNAWDRIAGCMYVGGKIKVKMTAPYNTTGDGYIDTGITMGGTSGGYISATKMTEYGRLPVTMNGSETTYTCDGGWYNASQVDYALAGGGCADGFRVGASALVLSDLVSNTGWDFGASLSCEQPLAA